MTQAPAIDRRDVLKLGGAAALTLLSAAPVGVDAASSTPSAIVVVDPRYRESMAFALSLERQGSRVVTLASDRARTWFDAIALQLPHGLRRLAGLTLESDLFILERLAESSGARTCYSGLHDWRCRQGVGHTLSGRIDLHPLATVLVKAKEDWAGDLGEALLAVNDRGREEQKLQLECALPSSQGPRSFVSWLMRWTV